jgi:hypothetical protein
VTDTAVAVDDTLVGVMTAQRRAGFVRRSSIVAKHRHTSITSYGM